MTATMTTTPSIPPSSRSAASTLVPDDPSIPETQTRSVVGNTSLAPGQTRVDAHDADAGGDLLPPTNGATAPEEVPSAASLSDPGHTSDEFHGAPAGADLDGDQNACDTHAHTVAVNSELSGGQTSRDIHTTAAVAEFVLGMAAASLDDIERTRISNGLRLGAMEREGIAATPEYATLSTIYDGVLAIEHQATLNLQRTLRKHPLGPWVKATVGIGEKQGARLIAAIGDPYWNALEERPRRGPAELWAYCGYAPGQKRRKGVRNNWNAEAKMRAFLIAGSCVKQMHSPYRAVYDAARASWADRETTDGHKHNHALRLVAKAVLRDLFLAAKEKA